MVILHFLLLSLHVFLGRVHGDAEIVPEKNRESFPLSANVFWCWLRMLLLAEYWGGAQIVQEKNRESFLLSKNVCWCWLRMLLLAEYVPTTMLDPKALGTALDFCYPSPPKLGGGTITLFYPPPNWGG